MYIWILLATIMVALSFYNVAPRADKEHALNEIKAATIVNRFKAEHVAMLRTIECEVIRGTNNNGWDGDDLTTRTSASGPVNITKYNPNSTAGEGYSKFTYTDFTKHVPIGYGIGKAYSNTAIKHYVYCLKADMEDVKKNDTEAFIRCDATFGNNGNNAKDLGHHRYLVTVIPVPQRWRTKGADPTPLPVITNLLAKLSTGTTVYGWTKCESNGCLLHGLGANSANYKAGGEIVKEKVKDDEGNYITTENGGYVEKEKYRKYNVDRVSLDKKSIMWKNTEGNDDVIDLCSSQPCILAYERIPWSDTACHCENLIRLSQNPPQPALTLNECYHTANMVHNDKYDTGKWKELRKKINTTNNNYTQSSGNTQTNENTQDTQTNTNP